MVALDSIGKFAFGGDVSNMIIFIGTYESVGNREGIKMWRTF